MKFQEILYNSSESSITGSVGFGVRAKTDGASEDVLKALNKSSFSCASTRPEPSKSQPQKHCWKIRPRYWIVL